VQKSHKHTGYSPSSLNVRLSLCFNNTIISVMYCLKQVNSIHGDLNNIWSQRWIKSRKKG